MFIYVHINYIIYRLYLKYHIIHLWAPACMCLRAQVCVNLIPSEHEQAVSLTALLDL